MSRGLVVIGRDGVLGESGRSPGEWNPLPGSVEALGRLTRARYRIVMTTNQQALGNDLAAIHSVHRTMVRRLHEAGAELDAVFFATKGDPESTGKRQPKIALFQSIQKRYGVALDDVPVIGDSREDLVAATHCGARVILVRTGRGRQTLNELADFDGVTVYADLAAAVDAILRP